MRVMWFLVVLTAAVVSGACSSSGSPVGPSAVAGVSTGPDTRDSTGVPVEPAMVADRPDHATAAKPGDMTLVDIVLQDDGEFDVLQAGVVRAGLAGALSGDRQLTVFAPTDAAFVSSLNVADEAAAVAAVEGLPLDTLTDILLYHVTAGRRTSNSVLAAPGYQMLNGDRLDRAELTAAGIAATDISASNGVIHVINAVLIP